METVLVFSITCFRNRFKHIVVSESNVLKRTKDSVSIESYEFKSIDWNKPLAGFKFIFESKELADQYIKSNLEAGTPVTLHTQGTLIRLKL